MRLEGKVALVTGSSRGIGRAIAEAYANEGARIVLNGTDPDALSSVEERIGGIGGEVFSIRADVSNAEEVDDMIGRVINRFQRIDILVANAGRMFVGNLEEIPVDEWDDALRVNLKSVFLCCKAIIPHMKNQRYGRIITMSSAGGKNPRTITGTHYGVTKAAILYLTKRIANDYGRYGIAANCICPGPVDTDMSRTFSKEVLDRFTEQIPLGRIGRPEDVAKVAVFLGSGDADYVTGEVIDVNGGSYID